MTLPIAIALLLAPPQEPQDQPAWRLPEDPRAVVLSLDYRGGFGPPRRSEEPYLEVRADGSLRVPDRTGGRDHRTAELAKRELRDLIDFVVEEQRLLEFDAREARRAMAESAGGEVPAVMDAGEVVVAVRLRDRRGEARFEALRLHARTFPGVDSLQRLAAVERRLRSLRCLVQLGGHQAVERLLERARSELSEEWPGEVPPLSSGDLDHVTENEDGSRTVRLERDREDGVLRVTLRVSAQGEVEADLHR